MPKLLIKHPEKGDLSFTLSGSRVSVGRRAENSIQINHGTVSGAHAELVAVNGHYVLRDLDSTNHSFVNGEKVKEVDLTGPCKITFGTVECDYVVEDAKSTGPVVGGTDIDNLRRNLGILRAQNDELLGKLAEQQKQIEILGSAKLLMRPSPGGDPAALKEQLKVVSEERDRLLSQNQALQKEVQMLRLLSQAYAPAETGSSDLKETVPIKLAPAPTLPAAAVSVTPDGSTRTAAPVARVVDSPSANDTLTLYSETVAKMRPLVGNFAKDPDARAEMLLLAGRLSEKSNSLANHPAGRMAKSLDAFLRDLAQRNTDVDAGIMRTITQGVDAFAEILEPGNLAKCDSLPQPSVLAVDDDSDFLPAMIASLEFARLHATGCGDAKQALTLLGESRFDLIILDLTLPDGDGLDICTSIRTFSSHAKTPIIVLTGSSDMETKARSTMRGSNDFIGKPCNLFELTFRAYTWVYKSQLGTL
jgi:CheY-like chemotaxis protein